MVFSPEEVEGLMNDLVLVGPRKPLGYLPISTLQMCGQDMTAVIDNARIKSLRAEMWGSHRCNVGSGAVFVWDANRIEEFIELNEDLLADADWPVDHHMFVRRIATEQVPLDTPLHELIDTLYSGRFYDTLSIRCPEGFEQFDRGFAGYIWNGSPAEQVMRTRYS
jgi:hypothetical protein